MYIGKHVNIVGGSSIFLANEVIIRPFVDLWSANGFIQIGEGTEIGERSRISIVNSLMIGKKVLISPNVYITDCDHEYSNPEYPVIDQGVVKTSNTVQIGDDSYIGINSVIVGNIKIGKHCVIGANSVVTKSIPDYSIAVGVPAKVIKQYNPEIGEWQRK